MTPEDRQRLERLAQFCRQTAADGVLPSLAWFEEVADELEALVRTGAVETPLEVHADRFEECGHWKCDDVLKRHPELARGAVETPPEPGEVTTWVRCYWCDLDIVKIHSEGEREASEAIVREHVRACAKNPQAVRGAVETPAQEPPISPFETGNCPHCGAWVNFRQEAEIAKIELPSAPHGADK